MSHGFSKRLQKQWLEYYLKELNNICNKTIDEGTTDQSPLEVIKKGLHEIEQRKSQSFRARLQHLESVKMQLKGI